MVQPDLSEYSPVTELCKIMHKFKSDKASFHHNYGVYYNNLLSPLVNKNDVNIFELGIGGESGYHGSSLRGWLEYFKTASIYGADIRTDIMINEDKIKTFIVDQRNEQSIKQLWNNLREINFDVIIDDGLHEWDANHTFLMNSYYKLKKGGIYIIEDIDNFHLNDFYKNIHIYKSIFSSAEIVRLPNEYNSNDNNLLICIM
jgi:hypothetical protein